MEVIFEMGKGGESSAVGGEVRMFWFLAETAGMEVCFLTIVSCPDMMFEHSLGSS